MTEVSQPTAGQHRSLPVSSYIVMTLLAVVVAAWLLGYVRGAAYIHVSSESTNGILKTEYWMLMSANGSIALVQGARTLSGDATHAPIRDMGPDGEEFFFGSAQACKLTQEKFRSGYKMHDRFLSEGSQMALPYWALCLAVVVLLLLCLRPYFWPPQDA